MSQLVLFCAENGYLLEQGRGGYPKEKGSLEKLAFCPQWLVGRRVRDVFQVRRKTRASVGTGHDAEGLHPGAIGLVGTKLDVGLRGARSNAWDK